MGLVEENLASFGVRIYEGYSIGRASSRVLVGRAFLAEARQMRYADNELDGSILMSASEEVEGMMTCKDGKPGGRSWKAGLPSYCSTCHFSFQIRYRVAPPSPSTWPLSDLATLLPSLSCPQNHGRTTSYSPFCIIVAEYLVCLCLTSFVLAHVFKASSSACSHHRSASSLKPFCAVSKRPSDLYHRSNSYDAHTV
jgi:hypothetical protein